MIFDPKFLILIAIASLSFGFLFGYLLRGFFRKRTKSDAHTEQEVTQAAETGKKKTPNRNLEEVAHLWRDRRNGKLVFQIEKKFYKRGADLSTKDRGILLKAVRDFYHWLEPIETALPQEDKTSQIDQPQNTRPDERVQSTQQIQKTEEILVPENSEKSLRIDLSPVNVITQALQPDARQSTLPSQSMVSQVDAILQEKLHRAGMKKWAIRLTEFPQRGMVVMVGLEQYDGIDEVPYERVRSIIRESVSEWEQRAETGNLIQ